MWFLVAVVSLLSSSDAFSHVSSSPSQATLKKATAATLRALSAKHCEDDLVAVACHPARAVPRLCVVKAGGAVDPLCQREDDVETDLFVDPRLRFGVADLTDDDVVATYGVGFYGQRPVPSLGGGPGYGATADEIWSVDQSVIDQVRADGVDLPVLDVGVAHGEKARGGAF